MKAGKLKELLEDYGDEVEVVVEVRGDLEEPDGSILQITDDRSVYYNGIRGNLHIIGDSQEEEE
jgi:hypothetical protein